MSPVRRLLLAACWFAALVAYVAAVLPQAEAPSLGGSDKLDHMAAFFAISLLARLAYRRSAPGRLLLVIAGFGALIEASQALPFIGRDAELADWVADVAAAALGLTAGWPVAAWRARRAGRD